MSQTDSGTETTAPGPAARDEDPFDDDEIASILDEAWDDLD